VTFRPSALAYALAVVLGWIVCLAIAVGRAELLLAAIPLLVRFIRSPLPKALELRDFVFEVMTEQRIEGDDLAVKVRACIAGAPGPIEVLPVLPRLLSMRPALRTPALAPRPDGSVLWEGELRCGASGLLDFGAVFFRTWDWAGLWVAESRREQRVVLPVLPRLAAVRTRPALRSTGAPFGLHVSQHRSDGTDFADIRRFAPGDRIKRINWPVSVRTRQLQVNQYYTERSAEIILLVDAFVDVGCRPDSSIDHCVRAAAGLAMSYLRSHDRVGLMEFGGWMRWTRPGTGPRQYVNIMQSLARVIVAPSEFTQDLGALPETMLPRHALIIALSPLVDQRFTHTLLRLTDQGRDVVLLALRSNEVSAPYLSRRASSPIVGRLWRLQREARLRELRGHGVRAVDWSPSLPIEAALSMVPRPTKRGLSPWYA
jgi:uncharacterized protein (DUF58 family)